MNPRQQAEYDTLANELKYNAAKVEEDYGWARDEATDAQIEAMLDDMAATLDEWLSVGESA